MRTRFVNLYNNEEGFVLVTGLLILVVLTMLGIAATKNTSIELQIAGNDRLHKETFYQAEAGAILGSELLEQNFNCATGFDSTGNFSGQQYRNIRGYIRAWEQNDAFGNPNGLAYWRNPSPVDYDEAKLDPSDPDNYKNNLTTNIDLDGDGVSDALNLADASFPIQNLDAGGNANNDQPNTGYLYMGGFTEMLPGGALQMAAGYEGKGKGSASGGVAKIIDIYSRFRGDLNSQAIVLLGWRHLIGSEGSCNYGP